MKKSLQILALLFCIIIFAQAPEKFSYQAVIRNAANTLVTNAPVGMKISILKNSAAGTVVYSETQTANTNVNGLISIQIGSGSVLIGTIAGIDWSNDSYYIKTETDPTGGTTYSIAGTSQLLSVPYAMYSKTSGSGASFTLPYAGTSSANSDSFSITNSGANKNRAGNFTNSNAINDGPAVLGTNNSVDLFGVGVQGIANSNSNGKTSSGIRGSLLGTGTSGAGVFGQANNAYGVYGTTNDGTGIYGVSFGTGNAGVFQANGTGKALFTLGPIRMISINEGSGKVLTSDANGNATWQDLITPDIHITCLTGTNQIISTGLPVKVINSWTGLQESGGANYNATTGEYTIPVSGYYSVNATIGFNGIAANGAAVESSILKNGVAAIYSLSPIVSGAYLPKTSIFMEMKLTAGDKISIAVDHNYSTSLQAQPNLSTFAIHLIHK